MISVYLSNNAIVNIISISGRAVISLIWGLLINCSSCSFVFSAIEAICDFAWHLLKSHQQLDSSEEHSSRKKKIIGVDDFLDISGRKKVNSKLGKRRPSSRAGEALTKTFWAKAFSLCVILIKLRLCARSQASKRILVVPLDLRRRLELK